MMPRSVSAELALTGRLPPTLASAGIESALETATPTAMLATSNAVGITQNRSRSHSCASTTRNRFLDSDRSACSDAVSKTDLFLDQSEITIASHGQLRH
jgi:hypothetical protein